MARRYTDEDKARINIALAVNEGNVRRTARELDLPIATVRDMKKKWDTLGIPAGVVEALPAVADDFVGNATRIRDKALLKYEEAVDAGKVNGKDLLLGVGILTDKVRLVQGQATSRTEAIPGQGTLPVAEMRELFAGFARGIVEATQKRDSAIAGVDLDHREGFGDVIEGDWEPVELPALSPPQD